MLFLALEAQLLSLLREGRPSTQQVIQCVNALPEQAITPASLNGTWRLLYTSKSDFDVKNPLGRRVDGTTPGIEGIFDGIFDQTTAVASSSPIQRFVTSLAAVDQIIDLDKGRVDQVVTLGNGQLRLSAAATLSDTRIDFTFDLAYFEVWGVRVPYPVPFRLLGDEACGWLDTRYVSPQLRVSTGNKGTTFILERID